MASTDGRWPMNIIMTNDEPAMLKLDLYEKVINDEKMVTAIYDGKFFTGSVISEVGETEFVDGELVNVIDYSTITKH